MIREELKQLDTNARALRKFGWVVGGVFLLLGGWFLFRHKPVGPYFAGAGGLLVALGAVIPQALRHVYLGWMALAFTLGFIVTTVVLTLFFFLVVTPVGLIARCLGKDFLSQKLDPRSKSYWRIREPAAPKTAEQYEQQF